MTQDKMIRISSHSTDAKELEQFAKSNFMLVRRAVARNRYTNSETLNKLLFDKVKNVSFIASKHHNCTQKRVFREEEHPCIDCQKDETQMQKVCADCETLDNFNRAS
jgi:hypothetical protein